MTQAVTYERETKSVAFQGKIIVLESLTPVLPPKEKAQRKKEIERCLYEVFRKYGDKSMFRTFLSQLLGSLANALAMATRCFCPPES